MLRCAWSRVYGAGYFYEPEQFWKETSWPRRVDRTIDSHLQAVGIRGASVKTVSDI